MRDNIGFWFQGAICFCVPCGEGHLNLILYAPSVPLYTPKWGIDHLCWMNDARNAHDPNVRRPTEEASILGRSGSGASSSCMQRMQVECTRNPKFSCLAIKPRRCRYRCACSEPLICDAVSPFSEALSTLETTHDRYSLTLLSWSDREERTGAVERELSMIGYGPA